MKYDCNDEKWINRDRFVLSNGHACALQYTMLHLCGYDVSKEDLKDFRQLDSKTPGHPECHETCGVEVSTGPLGQGISNAVGMAMARSHMAARYNRKDFPLFDHNVYVICGDGCLQEGVSSEACSLAGHLKLGSLIVLYDDNKIQIDGSTDLAFTEDVLKRYEAYGWHTQIVKDGNHGYEHIREAIRKAKSVTDKPSLIKIQTTIGYGSAKEGTHGVHGAPLGPDDISNLKKKFGMKVDESYVVSSQVAEYYEKASKSGQKKHEAWNNMFENYVSKYPDQASELRRRLAGHFPETMKFPSFEPGHKDATRGYSGKVLAAISSSIPEMLCGSADLSPSNKTNNAGWGGDFQAATPAGRYIRFGVREHAMVAISNGLHAYGANIVPACATFLTFTGYALGAMRVSALSGHQVLFVMTHDSIGLGEDGPTHQPIEHLATLRAMPNMLVFRPCDGNETSGAYKIALAIRNSPSTFALSRQKVETMKGSAAEKVSRGAYIIDDCQKPSLCIVGSGTEVGLCVQAKEKLKAAGIQVRVVSMPCWKLYELQPDEYKRSIFPVGVPVLSVEAGSTFGWQRYSHGQIGIDRFGKSGPGPAVMDHFGFNVENVCSKAKALMKFYASSGAPDLISRPF